MNVGYDNILTSTLHVVKLHDRIAAAAADTHQLQLSALLTVSSCNYFAWVAHEKN